MTEKQVLFESHVDIMSMPSPNWHAAVTPDRGDSSSVPSSRDLGWPLVSLAKVSSTGHSRFGFQHSSTRRGTSNYNYGYSAAERPDKPGLFLFSVDDDEENLGNERFGRCAWVHDRQRRWTVACWTFIALLSILILAVFAMILVFCIVIPKRPYLEVPDRAILVQALNVFPNPLLNTSGLQRGGHMTARLSAHFTLQLLVKNPNRVSTDYSSARFSVAYADTVVGEATVVAFSQKAHASTQKSVELIADANVSQQDALNLLTDANIQGNISLQIDGRVEARLQIMGLPSPPVLIKLRCNVNIKVEELQVTDQECHLSKHKVIW